MSQPPSAEDQARWHRWFAVECNNRAWQLADQGSRTAAEDDDMLDAAHAAALHWARVGTPLNHARAQMLLGHVHALLGNGAMALRFARASHAHLTAIDSPDWEIAFSHAVMANAAAAANDPDSHRRHHAAARAAGDAIADAADRTIFESTFARIPAPVNPPVHASSMAGTVDAIYVAATSGASMQRVAVATLVAGSGVHGDRNFRDGEHAKQITLIAAEEVERFNRETGLGIGAGDARRNVVTRGIALGELVGGKFRVGETTLIGVELCEPCATLGKRLASRSVSAAQVVAAFVHRAGLRARIVAGGRIAAGDPVGR